MMAPKETLEKCKKNIDYRWKLSFGSAFIIGLLVHLPIMLSDIPNHDGLGSMYFDQNMITSGRWFLTVACGISSYFTLPWMIGVLALIYLGCTAAALTELLELRDSISIVLVSGLLVVFPATASTFAYVFTMDGYMMALFLAVLAVLLTKKYTKGFVPGAVCLAFSMGIYQAYLPFAIILCIYAVVIIFMEEKTWKTKLLSAARYLYMGAIGVVLYYATLQILLKVQGKELADYQGISGMGGENAGVGLLEKLSGVYYDFLAFTLKGNVFFNNIFSLLGLVVLVALFVLTILLLAFQRKWWKKVGFFAIIGMLAIGVPIAANIILIISPEVTYHLLMRYHWVLFLIVMVAFVERYAHGKHVTPCDAKDGNDSAVWTGQAVSGRVACVSQWLLVASLVVLVFNYAVMDNIAYSNLEKRYEKTYAYCVRLLDRIEQTEGYYQGIPIAIVGVVGDEEFPVTDITEEVTGGMIGVSGDTLLYRPENYQAFMEHYLGASLNFMDVDTVADIYYSEEYVAMDSFPGENSVKLVDGVIYVKTENFSRD